MAVVTTLWPLHEAINWLSGPALAWDSQAVGRRPPQTLAIAATAGGELERPLLEQKLSLLESYLKSALVARIEKGGNERAREIIAEGRGLLDRARVAEEEGDLEAASRDLDEALRKITLASNLAALTEREESDDQAKARYQKLRRSIDSYLKSIPESRVQENADAHEASAMARVDELVANAESLAGSGRYRDANELLADAYRTTVLIVAEQYKGRTVVSRLSFRTPNEELEYERERNDSYEMLVELMMSERPGDDGSLRGLVDRYVAESRALRQEAEAIVAAGDYPAAIDKMEEATERLVRALRAGAPPVRE